MADLEQRISDDEIRAAHAHGSAGFKPVPFSAHDVRREIQRTRNSGRRRIVLAIVAAIVLIAILLAIFVFRIPEQLLTVETSSMGPTVSFIPRA